jgi:tetratricopeptide (TPR) repeat protein
MTVHEALLMLTRVRELAESGQHAAVVEYLNDEPRGTLEQSPTLALVYGIAQARLGRHEDGARWVGAALERSRERGDRSIEARALNVAGAIALEAGRVDEAAEHFTRALDVAERNGDHATVGRCSNNLGVIANLRGDHGSAVGSYTMALAAFQRAGWRAGVAEVLHNLAIAYRDRGNLSTALETAERAVHEADVAGDLALAAQTRGGRAEIRLAMGDADVARVEVERSLALHRRVGNVVGEAEDLRVLAGALAARGQMDEVEQMFLDVVARAEAHERPLLAAQAERDLARALIRNGRAAEAREYARRARVRFKQLGAEAEVAKLDKLIEGD